jgi:hypothetical protein
MFDLVAANHHGAGWMTTGFAVFLWTVLPLMLPLYVYRLVRDARAFRKAEGAARADLSDRLFGWSTNLTILVGSLFLATHRIWTTW